MGCAPWTWSFNVGALDALGLNFLEDQSTSIRILFKAKLCRYYCLIATIIERTNFGHGRSLLRVLIRLIADKFKLL